MVRFAAVIVFEDSDWLVVNKPTGIATHGGRSLDIALQEWLELHLDRKTFVCSRLDIGTSGVLVFAKSAEASGRAQTIHESGSSAKEYVFLSHLESEAAEWTVRTPIDGEAAETRFRRAGRSRFEAVILRGRTHQIRRHAQESGVPILGDAEYGGQPAPRLYLHCRRVEWPEIPTPLQVPVPDSFNGNNLLVCYDRRLDYLPTITNSFRAIHNGEAGRFAVDIVGGKELVWNGRGPERAVVTEHNLRYEVELSADGCYLKRRDVRRWLFRAAKARRVAILNDAACAAAAAAGGGQVTSVGPDPDANFSINGLRGEFVRGNSRHWLERRKAEFEVIVCPGGSAEVARLCKAALVPGGTVVFIARSAPGERMSAPLDFPGDKGESAFVWKP